MTLAAPERALAWSQLCFRAMGTDVRLSVLGDPTLLVGARRRVEELEARWSRFRPDSEVGRINRSTAHLVAVDEETFHLVALAVRGWRDTDGRFDPTVHDALCAAGYDRSFEDLAPVAGDGADVPGCAGIRLDPRYDGVSVPAGVRLDLGGIGKGRAADLVAEDLVTAGARSAIADLGGDLRIAGPPLDQPLVVEIDDPHGAGAAAATVRLREGALATSSTAGRRWTVDGEVRHHLIDPTSGRPATSGLASVTVLAADAAWAEVLAKAALVAGEAEGVALLERHGTPGLLVTDGGRGRTAAAFEEHLA